MMPTYQSLFSSPGCVSFSLQVLEALQEVALGQVSVDTQAKCFYRDQSQAQGIFLMWKAVRVPGYGPGLSWALAWV